MCFNERLPVGRHGRREGGGVHGDACGTSFSGTFKQAELKVKGREEASKSLEMRAARERTKCARYLARFKYRQVWLDFMSNHSPS